MAAQVRWFSLRTVARLGVALAFVFMGLLRGGAITAHADMTITFSEFAVGTQVSIQYGESGLNIPETPAPHIDQHTAPTTPVSSLPQIIDKSFTTNPGSFITRGTGGQVLVAPTCQCQPTGDPAGTPGAGPYYGVGPLTINFTQPQHHVALDAGFLITQHTGAARSLVLTAWSITPAGGNQILTSNVTPPIGPDNHITQHLTVDAPPGGAGIDRVTVDQTSPTSTSGDLNFGVNNLVIDNPVSGQGPKLVLPSITITAPGNYTTLYNTVKTQVQANITAPPGPGWHVDSWVYPPGSSTPVVQHGVGTFIGVLPHVHVNKISVALTGGSTPNKIELQLMDGSGNEIAKDDVFVTVKPRPAAVDVVPRAMEITQAINWPMIYPSNFLTNTHKALTYAGEPLVASKKTVVRLYGTVVGSPSTAVHFVAAALYGYVSRTSTALPGSPLSPQLGPTGAPDARIIVDPTDTLERQRLHPEASWNFVLPLSWTKSGSIRLIGRVNPDGEVPDPNTKDNVLAVTDARFFPTSTVEIRPRFFTGPVTPPYASPPASAYPGASDAAFTDGFMNSVLPVPDGAPKVVVPPRPTFTQCSGEGFLGLESGNCDSTNQQDYFSHLMSEAHDFWNSDNSGHAFDFHPPNTPYVIDEAQIDPSSAKLSGNGVIGMSNVPSHWITAEVGNSGDTTHESLHALGLNHASNAHGESNGGGNESWPYCHGEIALLCNGDPDTSVDSKGVTDGRPFAFNTAPIGGDLSGWLTARDVIVSDPNNGVSILKDPSAHAPYYWIEPTPNCTPPPQQLSTMHYHEVISYGASENPNCQNLGAWISTINYCRIFFTLSGLHAPDGSDGYDWCKNNNGFLTFKQLAGLGTQAALLRQIAHPAARAHASAQSLLVSGVLDQNFQLQSISLSPSTAPASAAPKSGKYTAEIVTRSGRTIKVPFDVSFMSTHAAPQESFSVSLPYPADAQTLVLLDPGNQVIVRLSRLGWKPALKILTPRGGQQTCDGLRLSWSFSNPGSPPGTTGTLPVHFDVSVSTDGGKTFQALAVSLQSTELAIPPGCSPGGRLIFRVTASDGFDTISANSARVMLPQAPPTVTITSPTDQTVVQPGIPVTFHGQAEDAQGNLIPDTTLRWVSDRDGVMGTGNALDTSDLSLGTHHITLTALSASGLSSSATIVVVVSHGGGNPSPNGS